MKRFGKVDRNHADIVDALRKCGWLVRSLASQGDGFPDLVVARGAVVRLVEVKAGRGSLTGAQQQFMADGWPVTIVRSVDDVLEL